MIEAPKIHFNSDEQNYMRAVLNPFKYGSGARVPSSFPTPSQCYMGEAESTITTNSSGNFTLYCFPNPSNTFMTGASGAGLATDQLVAGTKGNYYLVSDANLTAKGEQYRTVDFGVLLQNDLSFSNVTGRVQCTPFICPDVWVTQSSMTNFTDATAAATMMSGGALAGLSYPGSFEVSADQLIEKQILLTSHPADSRGTDWRNISNSVASMSASNAIVGGDYEEIYNSGTGVPVGTPGLFQSSNCKGMIGWIVTGTGFPASTAVLNVVVRVDAEVLVESNTTSNLFLPSGMKSAQSSVSFDMIIANLGGWETIGRLIKPFAATGLSYAKTPSFLQKLLK